MAAFDRGCSEYNRLSRRRVITAGALGTAGLALPELLRAEAAQASPKREMSCILVWLRGGPSSIDMWDMKPDAPADIRGEFKPIKTNVSGIEISDQLPLCAKIADKYCLVRSLTHPSDDHEAGSHVMATGFYTWPAVAYPMHGQVVQKVLGYHGALPPHVHLPEIPQDYTGGRSFLSRQDLPFIVQCSNDLDMHVRDTSLASGLDTTRLSRRHELLTHGSEALDGVTDAVKSNDAFYQRAFDILTGAQVRAAFDITKEPQKVRDRYGRGILAKEIIAQGTAGDVAPNDYNRSIIGQSFLMARRLVEAGTRFVTVVGRGWDTHADNFNRLKRDLLPYFDRALSALLTDLDERGLLDTTLVIVTGDFNRTPKINKDAGRDHWGHVQTVLLAGAGIKGGTVIGASDAQCAYPTENPYTPGDLAATIYHKFGISPETQIHAYDGRPFRIVPEGSQPMKELI